LCSEQAVAANEGDEGERGFETEGRGREEEGGGEGALSLRGVEKVLFLGGGGVWGTEILLVTEQPGKRFDTRKAGECLGISCPGSQSGEVEQEEGNFRSRRLKHPRGRRQKSRRA